MFNQFRVRYPKGSSITELVTIKHGKYVVRALFQVEGVTLATGLAAADTVELAEDRARSRALAVLDISPLPEEKETSSPAAELPVPPTPVPSPQTAFPEESLQAKHSPVFPKIPKLDAAPVSFSEPLPHDASSDAAPVSWEPNNLPFTDDVDPGEEEMPTAGDAYEFETPTLTPPLPPLDRQPISLPLGSQEPPQTHLNPPSVTPVNGDRRPTEPHATDTETTRSSDPIDFADIKARTDVEIRRLGWSIEEGRDYLVKTYNKRARASLTDQQLQEFLIYLESLPTPPTD